MTLGSLLALAGPNQRALARGAPESSPPSRTAVDQRARKPSRDGLVVSGSGSLAPRRVANNNGSPRPVVISVLVALGVVGGLALLGWLGIVMLDLKHLNTSGFTLP